MHLLLVDGSGYIFRAFHALPPLSRKSDGLPVGCVQGFCNMLFKLTQDMDGEEAPTHMAVIFDAKGKTFRDDIYDQYKAQRPPAPEELVPQFPLTRSATRAFSIPSIEMEGWEADDIMATYAVMARDAGMKVTIASSDKDLMQLVEPDGSIRLLDTIPRPGQPPLRWIGPDEVFTKFGVTPDKVVDVQALCGDSVDNVPRRAGHRRQDGGGADQYLWQSRNPARARQRDQAECPPRKAHRQCRTGPHFQAPRDAGTEGAGRDRPRWPGAPADEPLGFVPVP
jgi:DNA polymerase-1